MQKQPTTFRRDIYETLIWCAATPVLTIWFMLSMFPIISVINAWGDFLSVLVALAFFGTGAVALLLGLAGRRLLRPAYSVAPVTPRKERVKRVALLAAYAAVWMVLYGAYSAG